MPAKNIKVLLLTAAALIFFTSNSNVGAAERKPPTKLQKDLEQDITKTREELKKRKGPAETRSDKKRVKDESKAGISPVIGAGSSFEQYTGYTPYLKIGAEAIYPVQNNIDIEGSLTGSRYNQTYIFASENNTFAQTGYYSGAGVAALMMDSVGVGNIAENKYDLKLLGGMKVDEKIKLSLGYNGIFLKNNLADQNMHGLRIGGTAGVNVLEKTGGIIDLGFTYKVIEYGSSISLLGSPWGSLTYGFLLNFDLDDAGTGLNIGYDGQALLFERVERFYNGIIAKVLF